MRKGQPMKTSTYLGLFALFITLLSGCSPTENQGSDDSFLIQLFKKYPELKSKKVEITMIKRIIDGDTYETITNQQVRIIGVNTPEVFGETHLYGREASDYSKKRLDGKTVYLFKDVSETDKYKRLLRYLFIENDLTMFNETLVIQGFANTMTVPPNVMFSKKFIALEREARRKQIGLWNQTNSEPAIAKCEKPSIKGNINSQNVKIYHVPDGQYYDITIAEQMFCTEKEAKATGFVKSKK